MHFVDVTVGHPAYTNPATGEEPLCQPRPARRADAGQIDKYSMLGAGGNVLPMEGHLGVVSLPFQSYGVTLSRSVFTWYERIGRLLRGYSTLASCVRTAP